MAAHSSVLAWRIPRAEQPGGLQSMGSQSQARLTDEHFHLVVAVVIQSKKEACFQEDEMPQ